MFTGLFSGGGGGGGGGQYDVFVTACFFIYLGIFSILMTVIRKEPQSTMEDTHKISLDDYAVHPNLLYTHTFYC